MTPSSLDLPPFPGFRAIGLQFLRDLKQNNDRDWFKPRKAVYEDELVWPMKCLIGELAAEASRAGLPISADPASAIFRIYRDVRFSKNKNPYKTHIGAVLSKSGDKKESGGVYIHVEPGQSFISGGFWQPDNRFLQAWRHRIEAMPERFLSIASDVEDAGLTLESTDELKRFPRGTRLEEDHPASRFLKWKSFLGTRHVADDELMDPDFTATALTSIRAVLPLLEFGWELKTPPSGDESS
ncbi:MAG: DUF2461 domain-containing protein [Bacteroidota bacterium]